MVREVFGPIAASAGCEIDCVTFDDLTVSRGAAGRMLRS